VIQRPSGFQLGPFDIRDWLAPQVPPIVSQFAFALFCLGIEAMVRILINLAAPGAGAFALIYPAALLGTLYAGWQAGISAFAVSAFSAALVVAVAEAFRREARAAALACRKQLDEIGLLLREVDHRVRNNFAVVASLVDLQRRRAADEACKAALGDVLGRIDSVARAHRHLYPGDASGPFAADAVRMRAYLGELCEALADSLVLRGAVSIVASIDDVVMARDRAVYVGLIVNELVTNAAKHAFEGRDRGVIGVRLAAASTGFRLIVEDDGVGIDESRVRPGGVGRTLIEAFARQARGRVTVDTGPQGTRFTIDLEP
jgi:two-component sensor histidine kinase